MDEQAGDLTVRETVYLFVHCYQELKSISKSSLSGASISPTELVHEAFCRRDWGSQPPLPKEVFIQHFKHTIKIVLIDRHRRKNAIKRGNGSIPISLPDDVAELGQAFTDTEFKEFVEFLSSSFPDFMDICLAHIFDKKSFDEIAEEREVSPSTVKDKLRRGAVAIRDTSANFF